MPLDVLQPTYAALPDFLKRAIVWPRPGDGSFVSMHILFTKDGKTSLPGTPCATENDVARFIAKNAARYDVYVCMSTQTREKRPGRTDRKADNAGLIRSNFLDFDVKPGDPHAYSTEAEMLADISRCMVAIGLPPPTFVIVTGSGGRHLHWVHDQPLLPARWQPLQESLLNAFLKHGGKPDRSVSDCSRVLRIPGTFNHKSGTPRLVSMDTLSSLVDVSTVAMETILLPYLGQGPVRTPGRRTILKPASFHGAVLDPAFQRSTAPAAGDDSHRPTAEALANGCPWIKATLATGGNGQREPLWKEAMNVACHLKDGMATAHRFSSGDPRYVPADTENKFLTQKALTLGWPSCLAVMRAGASECNTCPHAAVPNGSPFHYMSSPVAAQAVTTGSYQTAAPAPMGFSIATTKVVVGINALPPGYGYNNASQVTKKGDDDQHHPIMEKPIRGGRLIRYAVDDTRLRFDTEIEGVRREIEIPQAMLGDGKTFFKALAVQDLMTHPERPAVRTFMISWVQTLHNDSANVSLALPAFGWHGEGFVYDGTLYEKGVETPVFSIDQPEINRMYRVEGDRALWSAAVAMVLARRNPGLNTIMLSAFAGPLVPFTAESGLWLHAVSATGGNKTTANRIAVAVWGAANSKLGREDTAYSVQKKMETVRNITVFHDDVRIDGDNAADVTKFAMSITSGQGRGRLTQDAKQRPVGYWSTLYSSNGNVSVREAFSEHSRRTSAAHMRVLEIVVPPNTSAGLIEMGSAGAIMNEIDVNYGHAAKVYAKYLGDNRSAVIDMVTRTINAVSKAFNCTSEERFWVGTIAVLLVSAALARHLGLIPLSDADASALEAYLGETLQANRRETADENAEATPVAISDHVAEYLAANLGMHGSTVVSAAALPVPVTPGRAPLQQLIEVNRVTNMVWFMHSHFAEWLQRKKLSSRSILQQMVKLGARIERRALFQGTGVNNPKVRLVGIEAANPNFPTLPF